jgi:hypothetical protein
VHEGDHAVAEGMGGFGNTFVQTQDFAHIAEKQRDFLDVIDHILAAESAAQFFRVTRQRLLQRYGRLAP